MTAPPRLQHQRPPDGLSSAAVLHADREAELLVVQGDARQVWNRKLEPERIEHEHPAAPDVNVDPQRGDPEVRSDAPFVGTVEVEEERGGSQVNGGAKVHALEPHG